MTGRKKRSGGARHGAGRLQTRFTLSRQAAKELMIITGYDRFLTPDITSEDLLEQWIHEHWLWLDKVFQENAKDAG